MKQFFTVLLIFTICCSLLWTLNGVNRTFQFSEIIDYISRTPETKNTMVELFNCWTPVLTVLEKTIQGSYNFFQTAGEVTGFKQTASNLVFGLFGCVTFIAESIVLALGIGFSAMPMVVSVIHDIMYYARIVLYIGFGIPL